MRSKIQTESFSLAACCCTHEDNEPLDIDDHTCIQILKENICSFFLLETIIRAVTVYAEGVFRGESLVV